MVLAAAWAQPARAAESRDGALQCLAIADDAPRLACYDREVRKRVTPSFSGRLNKTTERFHIEAPTTLRFQSDGAIFVLYLKSDANEVIQNLHLGGGGEASYVIDRSGIYFLDINGSESWRIWLEPHSDQKTN
ncbi:hypothetical protein [Hyphomicrobium sp. LHD-15]|uniref:hypothetical protein n=1 Tax=Hyphomicrobium sp. LHD-15 TaxID=3072142 RepID=UPI00280C6AEF|nr:hypothetical protein [Hyphomicrobium sp. LHD-15]MDQ8698476.1 hypothetical protein [Hyphomicrobium sp. LHD-15]